ncbi:RNA pseudouridine synthase 6, chloroplastic isoform X1 [Olea europaea subsp. europaea]|uniref:RNA pseudouridine synthase 6, chloroplastic isoform X1 n=1 Tax=Olea europaea subsp. europaea TaxID=158383 RepID=A0A8S0QZE4_OLEEU|nr:RNA pseudouridine synthase 6, chloroplastic isoform X1 [Olea europaea subsp. europaea]
MAGGAITVLNSVVTSSLVSSFLSASSYRGNLITPINLVRTLAFTALLKNTRRHQTFNNRNRSFSCESSAATDISSTSSTSLSNNGYPIYSRLLPCPSHNGPPRVEHLVVSEGGSVLEYICQALSLPSLFVADLIHFGAVFYALVCPDPPPNATPEQIKVYKEVTNPSVLRTRASIKGKTIREAQKTFRITRIDEFVEAGTYLRVHVHPKRFPRCYEIDWRSRIIAVTDSYVVLDKPAGTSVGGTTDNIEESCVTFASRALGLDAPLRTTHQIDNCTEGCVVLSRTKEYCSVFHGKIREKKVKKLYLALAADPVSIGVITHYMRPINIAPRLVSEDFVKGWYLCRLEVLECKKVPWPDALTEKKYSIEDCGWPGKDFAYECKIDLLTGRTHQDDSAVSEQKEYVEANWKFQGRRNTINEKMKALQNLIPNSNKMDKASMLD